ncbi:MAG: serine/threonine protein kinase [Planctomycetes bacterium]|nr:serine/threonine protein kinase [Planctomycetota bacterium]
MSATPIGHDPDEERLAEALLALEQRGEEGLQEFLTAHGAHATAIRDGIERLRRSGVLAPPPARPGEARQFGEFRVLRRLATGGMGVVYLAEHLTLQRQVALKAVRPELLQSPTARHRFQREVEAVARLHHPGIVPIVAVGDEAGQPWFAMEYIDGRTLEQLLQSVPPDAAMRSSGGVLRRAFGDHEGSGSGHGGAFAGSYWEACVRLVLQVAQTMTYVHARGIVHRDLKPSNVVVTPHGQALVLDFGLAHVDDLSRMTRSESRVGSPAYMAPEQVRGEAIDERVDVYGLAVTLYQLLTTKLPFTGATDAALETAIQNGAATPLRAHQRSLPRDLEVIVAVAMDRDRARRYGSMAAFAADLEALLAREPITARPAGPWRRLLRFAQRHPLSSTAAAALLLLALQFPLVLWRMQAASNRELAALNAELVRQRGIAEHERELAEADYHDALTTIETMLVRTGHDDLVTTPGSEPLRLELLERAAALYERLGHRRADATLAIEHARTLQYLGAMQQLVGDATAAEASWRLALQRIAACDTPEATFIEAIAHKLLGQSALARGAIDVADGLLRTGLCRAQSLADAPGASREVRRQTAELQNSLASARQKAGDRAEWRSLLLAAQATKTTMLQEAPADLATVLAFSIGCLNLADVHVLDGDHGAAITLLTGAIDRLQRLRPDTARAQLFRSQLASLFNERAVLLQRLGRLREAEHDHGVAYALREELRRDFPDTAEYTNRAAGSLHNLARTLALARRSQEALPLEQESVALHREAVRMAPHRRLYVQHLEYALVMVCSLHIEQNDWAALARAVDELEAGTQSGEGRLNAARIRVALADKLAAAAAADQRDRAAHDVAVAIDLGFADLDHFTTEPFARYYRQIEGLPAYEAALAKLRARR